MPAECFFHANGTLLLAELKPRRSQFRADKNIIPGRNRLRDA
jgi:hypothetical protein